MDEEVLAIDAVALGSASELHGALCGLMSSGRQPESWSNAVIELLGEEAITDARSLDAFAAATETSLRSTDLRFMPLLPDENEHLGERLEQLGLWCSGFVAGFGLVSGARELDEEARELLEDLISISQIEAETGGEPNEAAERDYVELTEFVKVAALILTADSDEGADEGLDEDSRARNRKREDDAEDYH